MEGVSSLTPAGWHFFYFSYKRWGWDDTLPVVGKFSAFREFQFYVSRAADASTLPDWYSYKESNTNFRPSIYPLIPFLTPPAYTTVFPAPAYPPAPNTFSVNIGHRQYPGGSTGKKLNGWFYLLGNYPQYWYQYDDPIINKYYKHGEANCPSECHICITAQYHLLGVNTCIEEVTYETVLLDTDSH